MSYTLHTYVDITPLRECWATGLLWNLLAMNRCEICQVLRTFPCFHAFWISRFLFFDARAITMPLSGWRVQLISSSWVLRMVRGYCTVNRLNLMIASICKSSSSQFTIRLFKDREPKCFWHTSWGFAGLAWLRLRHAGIWNIWWGMWVMMTFALSILTPQLKWTWEVRGLAALNDFSCHIDCIKLHTSRCSGPIAGLVWLL